jgi:hypothetical protein
LSQAAPRRPSPGAARRRVHDASEASRFGAAHRWGDAALRLMQQRGVNWATLPHRTRSRYRTAHDRRPCRSCIRGESSGHELAVPIHATRSRGCSSLAPVARSSFGARKRASPRSGVRGSPRTVTGYLWRSRPARARLPPIASIRWYTVRLPPRCPGAAACEQDGLGPSLELSERRSHRSSVERHPVE